MLTRLNTLTELDQLLDAVTRDGTTAQRALLPAHTPTLLQQYGAGPDSTADQYCNAITDYIAGDVDYVTLIKLMRARKVLS